MRTKNVCPCPNLVCPNHGDCVNCTSRHLRIGTLNYCGFYSILNELEKAVEASADSPSAQIIQNRIDRQTSAYLKCMEEHGLLEKSIRLLREQKSQLSKH